MKKIIKTNLIKLFLPIFLGCYSFDVFANNVQISNVQITEKSSTGHWANIQFDVTIENVWRINTGAQNWNAVWIFVKYQVDGGEWLHATLSSTDAHHVMPADLFADGISDGKGVFIYASQEDVGTYSTYTANGLKIRWNYGVDGVADDANNIDIRVIGIEMVFIPTGSFYVGSGGGETNTFYEYPTTTQYYQIASENEITIGTSSGNLYYGSGSNSGDQSGPIPAAFPKGYNGFYIMRYEVSQEQYVNFLNLLSRTQQNARTASDVSGDAVTNTFVMIDPGSSSISYRNGIRCPASGNGTVDPITFYCDYDSDNIGDEANDGQNIPCNFLTWDDALAYLDWAGLRPITELEFEKACRGTVTPVSNEYAWGNTSLTQASTVLTNPGTNAERAGNSGDGLCNYNDGNTFGPIRCGFAAISGSTRVQAGASYYGISELSGNLHESCVTIGSNQGRNFTGEHGDGLLDATGAANTLGWPDNEGKGLRGGSFRATSDLLGVSSRVRGYFNSTTRFNNMGCRGGRTAE